MPHAPNCPGRCVSVMKAELKTLIVYNVKKETDTLNDKQSQIAERKTVGGRGRETAAKKPYNNEI